MTSDARRRRVDALFSAALERPTTERASFLAAACGDDRELVEAVERLLAASEEPDPRLRSGAVLTGPFWHELASELSRPRPLAADTRVGPFRVVRELGRGGMAEVYLAERADGQYEQRVALKLLQHGPASDHLARRFAQERQILASLDHPNIARILDGGVADDGRPYFAMELVNGETIDRFCDRRRLGIEARLGLFVAVAQAVEAAHRNLIIHRDLKPSNILVDEEGRVKLLDFGIAKPLAAGHDQRTRTDLRLLTPEFASPEQVQGARVTAASDVYQLGVLLYLLLCGRQAHVIESRTPVAVLEAVCRRSPPPPSEALALPDDGGAAGVAGSNAGPDAAEIARKRGSRPRLLRRRLRGDLDAIVAKTLAKRPEERYPSVGRLIADLERHLAGRPVTARRPSWTYRANKFLARNAVASSAVAAALVLILALMTFYTVRLTRERDRAQREAAKATRVAAVLTDVFAAFDPFAAGGREVSARTILDPGAARIEQELADQPEVRARLQVVLGDLYRKLGHFDEAERLLEAALRSRAAVDDVAAAELEAGARHALGLVHQGRGSLRAARSSFEAALEIRRAQPSTAAVDLADTLARLAVSLIPFRELERAYALAREALAIREKTLGDDALETLESRIILARVLQRRDRLPAAREQLRVVRERLENRPGQADPRVGILLRSLGQASRTVGDDAAARVALERSRAILETALGPDHPQVASTLADLGATHHGLGDLERARQAFARALAIREPLLPPESPSLLVLRNDLGTVLHDLGRSAEAIPHLEQSLAIMENGIVSSESPHLLGFLEPLADAHAALGDLRRAHELGARALAIRREDPGTDSAALAASLRALADVAERQGDTARARALRREAASLEIG